MFLFQGLEKLYMHGVRLLLSILFLIPLLASAQELTPAEQAFLKEHPVIRTQCSHGSPAFEQVEDGRPTGYIIEYLRLLARTAGFEIDFGEGMHPWEETQQKFRARKIDFLTGTVCKDFYKGFGLLSEPYLYFHRVYVVRKDAPDVQSPADLVGKTVSVIRDLPFVDVWKEKYPGINLLMVNSDEEALRAVAEGRADATYTLKSTCDYFTARNGFSNLRIGGVEHKAEGLENCFRVAIRSDWPELLSIANKAMDSIPQKERQALWNEWFKPNDFVSPKEFSSAERQFIRENPVLRYSILPDAPPLEYFDADGLPCGLTVDYLEKVSEQTGLRLECVPSSSREDKISLFLSGQCDFLPSFSSHTELGFPVKTLSPHMTFPLVVATRIDVPFINSLDDCAGQRVGILSRLGRFHEYQDHYPNVEFVDIETIPDGLRELSQGRLFGVIAPQPVIAYYIQELYLGNLKITGTLPEQLILSAVVRSDQQELAGILNKVFRSVPSEERRRMLNRWMGVRFEQGFDYRLFWRILAGTGLLQLLIFFRYVVVARYNRKLKSLNCELAQSLKERDRIMSIISHDLRQPVHGYNQMLALLQSGEINPTDENGQRILTQSRQRGELAIESMENLLNWLNVRRGVRHPILLSPYRLVEDSRELLSASLQNKQLRVENRIDSEIRILADEHRLSAVLRNLMNNAIKFSQPGSSIEVEAVQTERGLQLIVRDYGTGMNAETVQQILEGTVGSVRGTGGEKGSGLGLGLCQHFLKEVGSELHVESSPGQGSTFSFILSDQAPRTDC